MFIEKYEPHYQAKGRPLTSLNENDALQYGNLFNDEYIGYLSYVPRFPSFNNGKEELMRKIQVYTAAAQDLKLVLDVYPDRESYFNLFKEYSKRINELVHEYENKFYPIFAGNSYFNNGYFTWITTPSVFY